MIGTLDTNLLRIELVIESRISYLLLRRVMDVHWLLWWREWLMLSPIQAEGEIVDCKAAHEYRDSDNLKHCQ